MWAVQSALPFLAEWPTASDLTVCSFFSTFVKWRGKKAYTIKTGFMG